MKIQLGLSSISGWNAPKAEAYRAVLEAFLQDGKYTGAAVQQGSSYDFTTISVGSESLTNNRPDCILKSWSLQTHSCTQTPHQFLTLRPLILDSRSDLGAQIPNPTQTSIHNIIYHISPFYFHNMHIISPLYLHLLYLHNIPNSSQIIDAADVLPNYIICPYMVWEYRQMSLSPYII